MMVLQIGHLPKNIGGKQSTGMASAQWEIAKSVNSFKYDIHVQILATDILEIETEIENTKVYGWNHKYIILLLVRSFLRVPFFFVLSILYKIKYDLNPLNSITKILFFYNRIKEIKPEIIHVHAPYDYILLKNIKYFKHCNKFITIHSFMGMGKSYTKYKRIKEIEFEIARDNGLKKIFVSTQLRIDWQNFYSCTKKAIDNDVVIPNGINTKVFCYQKELVRRKTSNKIRLLTIGSISELKGQKRVIKAISQSKLLNYVYYYTIGVGDKKELIEIQSLAKKSNVMYKHLGYKIPLEIKKILHYCDFMILPSSTEGYGLVYIESILCGTPVILPKDLSICKEPNLLCSENAIFLNSYSQNEILKTIDNLESYEFEKKNVANTIYPRSWDIVGFEYLDYYKKNYNK